MFENKKILILGMARSGYEVAKLLSKYNNEIIVTDGKEQDENHVKELESLGVKVIICNNPEEMLNESFDYVVKNPGIIKTHKCVVKANKLNIPVINEVEVAYHFMPKDTYIIGITGSNGKTTTTTMIYEILKKAGLSVHLAGNIGLPLSNVVQSMKEKEYLVIEISDHQLVDMYDFKTNISVMTNLSEVHLDFHGDYETYKNVKKKIFNHHTEKELAILNKDNIDVINLTKDIKSKIKYFSKKEGANSYIKDNYIYVDNNKVLDINDIRIKGMHNYENIMCVLLVLSELNVDFKYAKEYLKEFKGVEHRIEFVKEINGISFYNDSKATNTESTITALKSFEKNVIVLLGGLDRGHSFEPIAPYLDKVKEIICFGETKDRIYEWAKEKNKNCKKFEKLEESLKTAYNDSESGDTILLSPACASWDQYKCMEDRGNEFKNIVQNFKEK